MPPEQPFIELDDQEKHVPGSSWLTKALAACGTLIAVLYLSNIGAGIFELLPDNLPLAGNLDEALFTLLLVFCLRKLGIDLLPHLRKRD